MLTWLRTRRFSLRAKIFLVLVAVIVPTFLVVTLTQYKLTQPILEDEIKQIGITSAKTLAAQIVSSNLLARPDAALQIESQIQELAYLQPNILRMDVIAKDPVTGDLKLIASNIEEDPSPVAVPYVFVEHTIAEEKLADDGSPLWEINAPIIKRARTSFGTDKILGVVHLTISLKFVQGILTALWKITASAAIFSVATLIFVLSFFLRRTIENDRRLRVAESQNVQLTQQLDDAHRQLLNTEKLAVMGQLTASFAHEIGTPLNAMGGHLQLLREEITPAQNAGSVALASMERLDVITGQLVKIEQIVKGFLQNTTKPASQRQLVDLNAVVEKTLAIVRPRVELLGVELHIKLERSLRAVRVVPIDVEQILLNVVNNALDSLQQKRATQGAREPLQLQISSREVPAGGRGVSSWFELLIRDTGMGISKADLKSVFKPFFTTKPAGQGTGLGLTICRELVKKYDGVLEINAKEGAWAQVTLRFPYAAAESA